MNSIITPMSVSIFFVIIVVAFCFFKPQAARIFLGFFFLTMALAVNGSFTFGKPQAYLDYANGALIPLYRTLVVNVVSISPFFFGLLVMGFEIVMGILILSKGKTVHYGLIGTMIFLFGMAPLDWLQLPWLGLIVGEMYLISKTYQHSIFDMLFKKRRMADAA